MSLNKNDVTYWVEALDLEPHVEGGYFKQILKSEKTLEHDGNTRYLYTSILFLLEEDNPSHFHRLTVDEVWYYHAGSPVTVHMLSPSGEYKTFTLGSEVDKGQVLQEVVPAGTIFGSTVDDGFGIVSCMCAPGFEYEDFELMKKAELLKEYPEHEEIIQVLGVED